MPMPSRSVSLWAFVGLLGCAPPTDRGQTALTGIEVSGGETSAGPGPATDTGDVHDPRLDVGGGTGSRDGCNAVDLLFVIDNSGSMCDAQAGLAKELPGLVDAIYASLPASTDIHVGIVTTSFSDGGSHQQHGCVAAEAQSVIDEYYVTDHRVDGNGYQGRLYEYQGKRYFSANTGDASTQAPLAKWFSAAATSVGCNGGAFEYSSAAAAFAVDPSNDDVNGGFLRDEGAALAIFVLSNEVDQSPDPVDTYRDTVLAAKSQCGGDKCIVTAGLLGADCVPDADPKVWQFLNAFGSKPAWGDIQNYDGYAAVVSDALAGAIVDTCNAINPG